MKDDSPSMFQPLWSVVRRLGGLLILATSLTLAGCGGSALPPVEEGQNPYSYDDDEIDPANLQPANRSGR